MTKGKYVSFFDNLKAAGIDLSAIQLANTPEPLTNIAQEDALQLIKASISDQTAVPVAFMVYEDQKSAQKSGVFSTANCVNNTCSKVAGGHAVLITGLKDNLDALIIKNSWGSIGLDDQGQATQVAADQGFFLIKPDYLSLAENAGGNGWSFLLKKSYLRK